MGMFEATTKPRIFGVSLGADFPQAFVNGVKKRMEGQPLEALANVEILVNTRRMQTRLLTLFAAQTPGFLPRVHLITEFGQDHVFSVSKHKISPLRRRLELRQLIVALLERQPDLAPRAHAFGLADSLAGLMDEMHAEGVGIEALQNLDVGDMSDHWARSLQFISLVNQYFEEDSDVISGPEVAQRQRIEALVQHWEVSPPTHPIIVAGSTGSRGTTGVLMRAIASLRQGAIVFPGFDFSQSAQRWEALWENGRNQDHPQFRFAHFAQSVDCQAADIIDWDRDADVTSVNRNALISLSLCPAPATDYWLTEGQKFSDVRDAVAGLTLIEAQQPRDEARAIALIMKQSVHENVKTALITPDRNLTRQVAAILDRWNIIADDSAGRPLALSAPGRFLRQVAELLWKPVENDALLALLKHPLTHSSGTHRGNHLRWTREFELTMLRGDVGSLTAQKIKDWALKYPDDPMRADWADWVVRGFLNQMREVEEPLSSFLERHLMLAEFIANGAFPEGDSELWQRAAGEQAKACVDEFTQQASYGGDLDPIAYRDLFYSVISQEEVREPTHGHPLLMIWGTMEARVQGAERLILAGLNDGIWPEDPSPDPWLNRQMRLEAGLLLPERRIGLSAHDFQQAACYGEVILTRSERNADEETIASRWVNRLINLMSGMSNDAKDALEEMRRRGDVWLEMGAALDAPDMEAMPIHRPAPAPPVSTRPRQLSVTDIKKLVRDPYSIYAAKILGLRAISPLRRPQDAKSRGIAIHRVFERFISEQTGPFHPPEEHDRLVKIAREEFANFAPNRLTYHQWMARIEGVTEWFISREVERQAHADRIFTEIKGSFFFEEDGFTLTARADRVDLLAGGLVDIYDYKSGRPPTKKEQQYFDKQLLLEAMMVDAGSFLDVGARPVNSVSYLGMGDGSVVQTQIDSEALTKTYNDFRDLIGSYMTESQGYSARRAVQQQRFEGEFDHLARFGEWDDSALPVLIKVG